MKTSGVLSVILLAAVVNISASVRAEHIPSLTMADLVGADIIAVGRFTNEQGKIEFTVERMLRGDAAAAGKRMQQEMAADPRLVTTQPDGGLASWVDRDGRFGARADAARTAIWFLAPRRVGRQPIELADGFAALLAKKDPDQFFRLLQRLDSDMQRDAMEDLFANPDKALVARLHAIALQADSDLGCEAVQVLSQTRLLDPDKFWGKWFALPTAWYLREPLARHDAARMTGDLKDAIAAERNPTRLATLLDLIPYDSPVKVDLAIPFLDHPSELVRLTALCRIWDKFWNLNDKASTSPQAKDQLAALGIRVVPLLDQRMKVETDPPCKARLAMMLARADGVPYVLRMQTRDPIPPYSEAEELKFLISRLTSYGDRGFIMASAGREVAERFFDEGFKQLKAAAAAKDIYNTDMVYDGMGYVRDPRMFQYLAQHALTTGFGDSSFRSTLRSLGVQDDKRSLTVLTSMFNDVNGWFENAGIGLIDGLAAVSDKGALAYLKELQPQIKYHSQVPYLRARAMHGDAWAVDELLAAMKEPPASKFLTKGFFQLNDVIYALCVVDTPEATDALKRHVEQSWPSKSGRPDDFPCYWAFMENYTGAARRNSPLGEVARRDSNWLAGLAIRKMAERSLPARCYAADVFKQLTGQLGDYRPEAFARERVEPLKKLEAWWSAHKAESREQWLIAYFKDKGFVFPAARLDKQSLPVLAQALESDFFTHNLAVEQISAICQKYFTDFRHQESYQGQERMNVRILGWLQARGILPHERTGEPPK